MGDRGRLGRHGETGGDRGRLGRQGDTGETGGD